MEESYDVGIRRRMGNAHAWRTIGAHHSCGRRVLLLQPPKRRHWRYAAGEITKEQYDQMKRDLAL
jgi:hypothetical protein